MNALADLVVAAQSGNVEAYGRLVQATQTMAYAVALSVLKDSTAAQDAVQQAYLRAFRRLGDLQEPATFAGWLRRIVITSALNMAEAQGPDDEQREVCPGVLLSVSRRLTLELLQSPPSNRARVVVGCAVWGPGQLDAEIAESSWLTIDVDPALIFGVPPDQMWETAIRRLGTDPAKLQVSSGVH